VLEVELMNVLCFCAALVTECLVMFVLLYQPGGLLMTIVRRLLFR